MEYVKDWERAADAIRMQSAMLDSTASHDDAGT